MRHVPIAEFKDHLSELVAAVEAGDEIVITRHGRAAVKVYVRLAPAGTPTVSSPTPDS